MADDSKPGFFGRLFASLTPDARTTGPPTSSNGASSMHLIWPAPSAAVHQVSVEVEVAGAPQADHLYFWALQTGFARSGGASLGAGHVGLQWHPSYPGNGAINWGGYRTGGGELSGSALAVPSALNNVNTGNYGWSPGRRYRITVGPWIAPEGDGDGEWPAAVTDLASGERLEIRRLFAGGPELVNISMWSEVFAHCDDPSVTVRWSAPTWVFADGTLGWPSRMRVNYQSWADGGCDNTNCAVTDGAFTQTTNADRVTPLGTELRLDH